MDKVRLKVRIAETGEFETLHYDAKSELAPCGFHPGFFDICPNAQRDLRYDEQTKEYECNQEVYEYYRDLCEGIVKIDDLGDHLISNYGFDLMDVSKKRGGFGYWNKNAERRLREEYKNLIIASNTFTLREYFKEPEVEAENLYGQNIPQEYKGFFMKADRWYPELIEAMTDDPLTLEDKINWLQDLNSRRRYMAARGIITFSPNMK